QSAGKLGASRIGFVAANNAYATWTSDTSWHHLAVTLHNTNGIVIYLDGASIATGAGTQNVADPSRNIFLGARNIDSGTDFWFNGAVDDVAIFNRALTSAEVAALAVDGLLPRPIFINQAVNRSSLY